MGGWIIAIANENNFIQVAMQYTQYTLLHIQTRARKSRAKT